MLRPDLNGSFVVVMQQPMAASATDSPVMPRISALTYVNYDGLQW